MLVKNLMLKTIVEEQVLKYGRPLFYHGATDMNLSGKNGIHIGSKMAATQALQAKIGVPATGVWDGTRVYGETLLAGKKTLENKNFILGYDPVIYFNAMADVPEYDYYPDEREKKATYFSSDYVIPLDCKPIVFKVIIIGDMMNTFETPLSDLEANNLMYNLIKKGDSDKGIYYINEYEDFGSISAVVPNGSFLKII